MVIPTLKYERLYWSQGYQFICGIDEVGRGSWAGPLVVAGVILPQNFKIPVGLADSKQVRPAMRYKLSKYIQDTAVSFAIAQIEPRVIDKHGVGQATHKAFRKVVRSIKPKPDFCLIDALYIKHFSRKHQLAVKNGDKISASIAAASIIAKVYRDQLMENLSKSYPQYGLSAHKGYGTKAHQEAIKKHGLSKIHRASYNLNFLFQ